MYVKMKDRRHEAQGRLHLVAQTDALKGTDLANWLYRFETLS